MPVPLYGGQAEVVRAGSGILSFGDRVIRSRAPYPLERDTSVKKWDNGDLVVRKR